ncbi:MAG TPA: transporter substrate-binding domain-containing protein [Microlunatus sp.]|nr:transporter substrate-binding domain-containing protein [Microlunatus sp.]
MDRQPVLRALVGLLLATLALTSCGLSVPADPEDTLERVTQGTLRVGVSPQPPWTGVDADGEPTGPEIDLVTGFAERLDAEVDWVVGGEEQLVTLLEHGDLDLVVGGFTADTPWSEQAAVTRPYHEGVDATGESVELVMLARMGENAFLRDLETFLHEWEQRQDQGR